MTERSPRKLPNLSFRPTPEVRDALDEAAEFNGRSLSAEILSRLERSFERPDAALRAVGGSENFDLFYSLRMMISRVCGECGRVETPWQSAEATAEAEAGMAAFWEYLRDNRPELFAGKRGTDKGRNAGRDAAAMFVKMAGLDTQRGESGND